MDIINRIMGIFYEPGKVFRTLSQKPDWLVPFLLVFIVSLLFILVTLPKFILPEQAETIMERFPEGMPQEEKDEIVERMSGTQGLIFGILGTVFVLFFLLFGRAGIFLGVLSLMGGKPTYTHSLAVVSYSMLIHSLDAVIKGILMFIKGTSRVYTSLALLLPEGDPLSKSFQFLARFDVFTLWELSLLSIGFSVMNKISFKKLASIVFGLWIFWVILSVSIGGTFQFGTR